MNINDCVYLFQEAAETAAQALAELGRVLIQEGLFERLGQATADMRKEASDKGAEAERLRRSHSELTPRIEAKLRILDGEIDAAVAAGRDDEAQGKRDEARNLKSNLEQIPEQVRACESRVTALQSQQRQLARRIFEESYPEIRKSLVQVELSLVNLLDRVWDEMNRYARETDNEARLAMPGQPHVPALVTMIHKVNLTPYDTGLEGHTFARLLEWFGGRR